jgi:hypothetical protein
VGRRRHEPPREEVAAQRPRALASGCGPQKLRGKILDPCNIVTLRSPKVGLGIVLIAKMGRAGWDFGERAIMTVAVHPFRTRRRYVQDLSRRIVY